MKRPSLFIIKKCLVWRLSDFSSVTNLPGISVPESRYYFKIQKFTSNDEEQEVKFNDGYKINPPKNCVTFLGFEPCFQPSLFLPQWTPQSRMLAVEHPEYIIIGFLQYNLHWTTLKSPLRQKRDG